MRKVAASLAAVFAGLALAACDFGAEPDVCPAAPERATLVLDFSPNAVHTGIYTALRRGFYEDAGVELEVREPSASTDAPKLLASGRADFAIVDIHDIGISFERVRGTTGIAPIVQRPLAAVIAGDRNEVRRPRDLEGRTVGVTGLPSDDAVLDSVLLADGANPDRVKRVTIGFNSVPALAAGKVDAVTAFWNAEGVALRGLGIPTREFRVDDYGAPSYPELLLSTAGVLVECHRPYVRRVAEATARGYRATLRDPEASLDDLLTENPELERHVQRAQLRALIPAMRPVGLLNLAVLKRWARWDIAHGILKGPAKGRPSRGEVNVQRRVNSMVIFAFYPAIRR